MTHPRLCQGDFSACVLGDCWISGRHAVAPTSGHRKPGYQIRKGFSHPSLSTRVRTRTNSYPHPPTQTPRNLTVPQHWRSSQRFSVGRGEDMMALWGPVVYEGPSASNTRILPADIAAPSGSVPGEFRSSGQDAASQREAKSRWKDRSQRAAGSGRPRNLAKREPETISQGTSHQSSAVSRQPGESRHYPASTNSNAIRVPFGSLARPRALTIPHSAFAILQSPRIDRHSWLLVGQ